MTKRDETLKGDLSPPGRLCCLRVGDGVFRCNFQQSNGKFERHLDLVKYYPPSGKSLKSGRFAILIAHQTKAW